MCKKPKTLAFAIWLVLFGTTLIGFSIAYAASEKKYGRERLDEVPNFLDSSELPMCLRQVSTKIEISYTGTYCQDSASQNGNPTWSTLPLLLPPRFLYFAECAKCVRVWRVGQSRDNSKSMFKKTANCNALFDNESQGSNVENKCENQWIHWDDDTSAWEKL